MTLPSHRYRDPLEVVIFEESLTCRGCIYVVKLWGKEVCALKNKLAVSRCRKYEECNGTAARTDNR